MSIMEFKQIDLLIGKVLQDDRICDDLCRTQMRKAAFTHMVHSPDIHVPFADEVVQNACKTILDQMSDGLNVESEVRETGKKYTHSLLGYLTEVPYPAPKNHTFRFIDLFAGIGGFRLAFQAHGGKCVFSSEWDKFAQQTYFANYGEIPYGDIREIDEKSIPEHDILCAGFPCQPFSLAGVSKKNALGREHGFKDETQGTLFFDIKRIIQEKRPKAFMLENVKNLISHDKGNTFKVIKKVLEDDLGYVINWKIVDGGAWVPQHRERIFIVGYDPKQVSITKDEIHIPEKPDDNYRFKPLNEIVNAEIHDHTLGEGTWETLKRHKAHHAKVGNGFGYGLIRMPIEDECRTRTISARYHKDGAEILIEQKGKRPRRLTVKEAMQLQGYDPETFIFPVSKTQAYRQIGNSVVVPSVQACAGEIVKMLKKRTK